MKEIFNQVLEQNKEIHLFRDDDVLGIAQMVLCKAQELNEAVNEAFVTDDLTSVVSEAADCFYLLIRLFNLLGIDEKAIEMKIYRNYLKYMGFDSREQAISEWKASGGDKRFFEHYLLVKGDDEQTNQNTM